MNVAVYSAKPYEREILDEINAGSGGGHTLRYLDVRLEAETAPLASGYGAAAIFANDNADRAALEGLAGAGVRLLALRSAGFNHVDLKAAEGLGMTVARVPAYSPYAVAEHAVALMMAVNRKVHRAFNRVREHNFELTGLMGFDLHGKTVGVAGTGKIGQAACAIMRGFGCRVLAYDIAENAECVAMGVRYVDKATLLRESAVLTLHMPLNSETKYFIDGAALWEMPEGAMLVNTARGGLVNTRALIETLVAGGLRGGVGLDVYEDEAKLFFQDRSLETPRDEVFARLLSFPNVLVTAHQGFLTREAVRNISQTTIDNVGGFERGAVPAENVVVTGTPAPPRR